MQEQLQPPQFEKPIVDIDQARFMDRLDYEWEELWDSLIDKLAQIPLGNKPIPERKHGKLYAVWKDPLMPRSFRDRAMLVMMGSDVAIETLSGHRLGKDHDYVEQEYRREYSEWLHDAFMTQIDSGEPLLSEQTILECALTYLDHDLLTPGELDAIISSLNPRDVVFNRPWSRHDWPGLLQLDPRRLPLLDDILSGEMVFKKNGPVEIWAARQLEYCFEHLEDVCVPLPSWIKNTVSEEELRVALGSFGHFPKYPY